MAKTTFTSLDSSTPSDIALLLRSDAEQRWLDHEVVPVVRQLEALDPLPGEEIEAALAYLEVSWDEARLRAHATDAAHLNIRAGDDGALADRADRYYAAVRALRRILADRVAPYIELPSPLADDGSAQYPTRDHDVALRVRAARAVACEDTSGCTPRAA